MIILIVICPISIGILWKLFSIWYGRRLRKDTQRRLRRCEEMKKEIISEMGNLILNGVVGSISNILETKVHYEVPYYYESGRIIDTSLVSDDSSLIMLCIATMRVKSYSFEFDLILVFNDSSFTKLNDYLKLKLKDIE